MSFIDIVEWHIREGKEEEHHEMMRTWFRYVKEHHADMFEEWKSSRYYQVVDKEGKPTGRYIMAFEFKTLEGFNAYKKRRDGFPPPYVYYKTIDPYQFFVQDEV